MTFTVTPGGYKLDVATNGIITVQKAPVQGFLADDWIELLRACVLVNTILRRAGWTHLTVTQ